MQKPRRFRVTSIKAAYDSGWWAGNLKDMDDKGAPVISARGATSKDPVPGGWCKGIAKGCVIEVDAVYGPIEERGYSSYVCSGVRVVKEAPSDDVSFLKRNHKLSDELAQALLLNYNGSAYELVLDVSTRGKSSFFMGMVDDATKQAVEYLRDAGVKRVKEYQIREKIRTTFTEMRESFGQISYLLGSRFPMLSEKEARRVGRELARLGSDLQNEYKKATKETVLQDLFIPISPGRFEMHKDSRFISDKVPYSRRTFDKEQVDQLLTREFEPKSYLDLIDAVILNPYLLYLSGCIGWAKVDKIALTYCGVDANSHMRALAATYCAFLTVVEGKGFLGWNVPDEVKGLSGSTYQDGRNEAVADVFCATVSSYIGRSLSQQDVVSLVLELVASGQLVSEQKTDATTGETYTCMRSSRLWHDERLVADGVVAKLPKAVEAKQVSAFACLYKGTNDAKLDQSQISAVVKSCTNKVSIVTGGPGSGKSFTIGAIASAFLALSKAEPAVFLLAPTGKAVRSLRDKLPQACIDTGRIMTVASYCLRALMSPRSDKESMFAGCSDVMVIVDEASMLSISDTAKIMAATPRHARFVFVGDVDQLPSVGPGEVLDDFIKSGKVVVARLNTGHRQIAGSSIPSHAMDIARGNVVSALAPSQSGDFDVYYADGDKDAQAHVLAWFKSKWGSMSIEDASRIAVLTPINGDDKAARPCTRVALNRQLREISNRKLKSPGTLVYKPVGKGIEIYDKVGYEIPGSAWSDADLIRIGDRVLCCENDADVQRVSYASGKFDDGESFSFAGVVNGDTGIVEGIVQDTYEHTKKCLIRLDDGCYVQVSAKEMRDSWVLGWAMTIHKSQGSEYDHVLIVLPESCSTSFVNRNLVYTAVTRAKESVFLVGGTNKLLESVGTKRTRRNTSLAETIIACK